MTNSTPSATRSSSFDCGVVLDLSKSITSPATTAPTFQSNYRDSGERLSFRIFVCEFNYGIPVQSSACDVHDQFILQHVSGHQIVVQDALCYPTLQVVQSMQPITRYGARKTVKKPTN
jgi:hypothetical protein